MNTRKYAGLGLAALGTYLLATAVLWPFKSELLPAPTASLSKEALAHEFLELSPGAPIYLLTEPQDSTTALFNAISDAEKSIDLVIYELEDPQLEQALVDAHAHGVMVRVILDNLNTFGNHPNEAAYEFLQKGGVEVEWSPQYFALTHQKTLLVDGARAFVMTFNLTPQYYATSRDFLLADDDPKDVASIAAAFESDWQQTHASASIGSDLVWSPGAADTLLNLIASATSTLDIYNEEMADPRIIDALKAAAERGVVVRVDMTYATNWKSAFNELVAAGVNVRTYSSSAKFYIHAKAILADETVAFVGSQNFSSPSLDQNRELGILLRKPDIISSLEHTFEADWAGSRVYTVK